MFKLILNWFLKPYPLPLTSQQKIWIALGFGNFVFLFLLVFKPFGFYEIKTNQVYYAFVYGIITASTLLLFLFIPPYIFPRVFNPNKWVIYKMIAFVIVIMSVTSIVNWFFSNTYLPEKTTRHSLLFFVSNTVFIGFFPLTFYVFIVEKIRAKKHQEIANNITANNKLYVKKEAVNTHKTIVLTGDNRSEKITIAQNDLLYISSEKNYASVFYLEDNKIKEKLLRISLTKLEEQFQEHKAIVRCHKSYIINTQKVTELQGNARSYVLKISFETKEIDAILIPVSRSFPKELLFTLVR